MLVLRVLNLPLVPRARLLRLLNLFIEFNLNKKILKRYVCLLQLDYIS